MNQFNLGNFLNKFVNYSLMNSNKRAGPQPGGPDSGMPTNGQLTPEMKFQLQKPEVIVQNIASRTFVQTNILSTFRPNVIADTKMGDFANLERSLYVKDLMNVPKEMEEALVIIQNNMALPQEAAKLLSENIGLLSIADLLQKGGKEALNKLVYAMAEATRQGITDVSQFKEAIKFINASVSVAGQNNPAQLIKNFILLYLPWLPLPNGVDFELEFETSGEKDQGDEVSVTILISTIHYGNVKITLVLPEGGALSIVVNCSKEFPKEELLERISTESKNHSLQSDVVFEEKNIQKEESENRQAKVSMSNLKAVNPFLLLMANAVIRHTIELDSQAQ